MSRRYTRFLVAAVLLLALFQLSRLRSSPFDAPFPPGPPPNGDSKAYFVPSSFDWSALALKNPVSSPIPLPTGAPRKLPQVQHAFTFSDAGSSATSGATQPDRRDAVKRAFEKCWTSYKKHAWMKDELAPLTGGSKTTFGGWAATLIDSLDTLWIMDLHDEFHEAVRAVAALDWNSFRGTSCNVFETTIRHLGGLLSAYDLSGERVLLQKAVELGDLLYMAFDTPNRMPPFWLDFKDAKAGRLRADNHEASASPCSLSLEFTRLAQITGDGKYYDAIARVTSLLELHQNQTRLPGMWPQYVNMREEKFDEEGSFTLGASADSLYEYLPKTFALLGGLEPVYEKLYRATVDTIQKTLLFRPMLPNKDDILFSGVARVGRQGDVRLEPESEHLTCFVGGMFALAGRLFSLEGHVELGEKLAKGCIYAYKAFPSGIMPEIFDMIACESLEECEWDEAKWKSEGDPSLPKGFRVARARTYILRPEAIESVFLLYRMTGKEEYREAAWEMFTAIMNATETKYGNAAILDVNMEKPEQTNSMESFWLAETLKYFYLIFSSPDLISLDNFVLNTEAHPLRRPT